MRCVEHPLRIALAECVVCGSFRCEECSPHDARQGGPVCPACALVSAASLAAAPAPRRARLYPVLGGAAALLGGVLVFALISRPSPPPDDDALSASAMAALAAAGTAAERHRGVHGAWPRTLGELVPSQLSAVPPDPFADGRPLSLGPDPVRGDGLVIYSVGPDRTDHHGLPRDPVTGRGDLLYPLD